jgi:uncharacterized protein (DUF1015 family)
LTDLRPFPALRYRPETVGDLGAVLAPPYDVISPQEQLALYDRSPYNVVRLEHGLQQPDDTPQDNRYTRAAATLAAWLGAGVLRKDDSASFYVYQQTFDHEGRRPQRRALFARARLEEWSSGAVRPHEHTMAPPKEDRLQLLRHCRVNTSPLFALYRDAEGALGRILDEAAAGEPLVDATDPAGQRHRLSAVRDPSAIETISAYFRERPVYMADGHHRYETALAYRDERRAAAGTWSGDESENFALMALTAAEDPGLVVRPIHRLASPPSLPADLAGLLGRFFTVEELALDGHDAASLVGLVAARAAGGASAFALIGPEAGRGLLLTLDKREEALSLLPAGASPAWRSLDVALLHYVVFGELLGIDPESRDQSLVTYCDYAEETVQAVASGRYRLGVLLNATRVEQILAVADAGERMPHKSTYFYPKLPTGLVMNPLD